MILDRGKFGDNVSDTATGEVVSLFFLFVERGGPEGATGEVVQFGFYSSKEADLKVMAICLTTR